MTERPEGFAMAMRIYDYEPSGRFRLEQVMLDEISELKKVLK